MLCSINKINQNLIDRLIVFSVFTGAPTMAVTLSVV